MDWYYTLDNEQHGPLAEHELRRIKEDGIIHDNTLVWTEGMARRKPYAKVFQQETGTANPPSAISTKREYSPPDSTEKISSHIGLSVVSMVLATLTGVILTYPGILPFTLSAVAILSSSRVDERLRRGDGMGAFSASRSARNWSISSIVITFLLMAILFLTYGPCYFEAQTRAKVSRIRSDTRSLAIALEAYRTDHNVYPVSLSLITTPIAYMEEIPEDIFTHPPLPISYEMITLAKEKNLERWILWSVGPDKVLTLNPASLRERMSLSPDDSMEAFNDILFDPTNGTWSDGDIIHIGGDK